MYECQASKMMKNDNFVRPFAICCTEKKNQKEGGEEKKNSSTQVSSQISYSRAKISEYTTVIINTTKNAPSYVDATTITINQFLLLSCCYCKFLIQKIFGISQINSKPPCKHNQISTHFLVLHRWQ